MEQNVRKQTPKRRAPETSKSIDRRIITARLRNNKCGVWRLPTMPRSGRISSHRQRVQSQERICCFWSSRHLRWVRHSTNWRSIQDVFKQVYAKRKIPWGSSSFLHCNKQRLWKTIRNLPKNAPARPKKEYFPLCLLKKLFFPFAMP